MKKIGVDLGGTTIKGALLDGDKIIKSGSVPTHGKEGRGAILTALFSLVDTLLEEGVSVIGISSAGNIDPSTGVCVYATDNLTGWTGADIRGEVEGRYRIPCKADNDAVCALKGELTFYPEIKNATMLTFGTGVGGASLVNGQILRGAHFDAARWGHLVLVPDGRACNCGKRGCAESYLSATALVGRGKESIPDLKDCKQLFALAEEGNKAAEAVLREFGVYLNLLLDNIRTALAPELIILGGGVAKSKNAFLKLLTKKDDVRFAQLGDMAGVFGAIQ